MTFKKSVESAAPPLNRAYQAGLRGLKREHRKKVRCPETDRLTGSVNLDAALARAHVHWHRWDYGIGYRPPAGAERAIWVEVHPATTGEVDTVLKKLAWLRSYLRGDAPQLFNLTLSGGTNTPRFVWLSTSFGTHINEISPQARRLRQAGLAIPRRVLQLP